MVKPKLRNMITKEFSLAKQHIGLAQAKFFEELYSARQLEIDKADSDLISTNKITS